VTPFYQVLVVTGPRQSGKSTLCRHIFKDYPYYNLEDPELRQRVKDDPKAFFRNCAKEIIIDEVQAYPVLLSYIQVIVDEDSERRFVLTGSSNFAMLQGITQSLAGRAAVFTLLPLSLRELPEDIWETPTDSLLYRGFYPAIFSKHTPSTIFYSNYYATYVERDVRQLIELKNQDRFMTFMRLCALRIGSELNKADLAKSVGVSATTIGDWISILKASYILFTLSPFHANVAKRLTKTPKIYFYDTGLACYLMGIKDETQLPLTGMKGALFENLAVVELMKHGMNEGQNPSLMFYRENAGKEVDIVDDKGLSIGLYEVKSSSSFKSEYTRNLSYLKSLLNDRQITTTVVYDGEPSPPSILNIRDI
ncbi:MAG: ATP-binding protein, partial [Muribaculaceae bacterium]|nr:ATP-binding protein [Muribaculaceae bacterium]